MNKKLLVLPVMLFALTSCGGGSNPFRSDTSTTTDQGSKTDENDRITLVNNVNEGLKKSYKASFEKGLNFSTNLNVKGSYDTSDSYSDGKDTVTKSTHVGIENFSLENKAFIKNVGDEKVSTNFNDLEIAEELKLNAKNIEFKSVSPSYDYKEDGSYTLNEVTSEFKLNELKDVTGRAYFQNSKVYADLSDVNVTEIAQSNLELVKNALAGMQKMDPSTITDEQAMEMVEGLTKDFPRKFYYTLTEKDVPDIELPSLTDLATTLEESKTSILMYLNLYKDYFTLLKDANNITTLNVNLDKDAIKEIVLMNTVDEEGKVPEKDQQEIDEVFKNINRADLHFGLSFDKDFMLKNVDLEVKFDMNYTAQESSFTKVNFEVKFDTSLDYGDPFVNVPDNFDDYVDIAEMFNKGEAVPAEEGGAEVI